MSKSNEHESGDDRRERQCEEDLKAKIAALTAERDTLKDRISDMIEFNSALASKCDALKAAMASGNKSTLEAEKSLADEIERLKAHVNGLVRELDFARADCRRWRDIEMRLRTAMERYGRHEEDCSYPFKPSVCECGLDAVLTDSQKEEKTHGSR